VSLREEFGTIFRRRKRRKLSKAVIEVQMEVVERESTDLKSITLAFTIVTLYMKHVGGADSIHKVCAGTKLGRFVD